MKTQQTYLCKQRFPDSATLSHLHIYSPINPRKSISKCNTKKHKLRNSQIFKTRQTFIATMAAKKLDW